MFEEVKLFSKDSQSFKGWPLLLKKVKSRGWNHTLRFICRRNHYSLCIDQPNQVWPVSLVASILWWLQWMVQYVRFLRLYKTHRELHFPHLRVHRRGIPVLATVYIRKFLPSQHRVSFRLHVLLLSVVITWDSAVSRARGGQCSCHKIVCVQDKDYPWMEVQGIVVLRS